MEVKAKLKNVYQNIADDCTEAVFQVPNQKIAEMIGKDVRLSLEIWRESRSRNANNYFYLLVNKIAQIQNIGDREVHDKLLSENLAYFYVDGAFDWVIQDWKPNQYGLVRIGDEYYLDSHRAVTLSKQDGSPMKTKDGKPKTSKIFWHIKGSHQMDTKEMARLIESTVFEAKNLGIETIPPAELQRLVQAWKGEQKHE